MHLCMCYCCGGDYWGVLPACGSVWCDMGGLHDLYFCRRVDVGCAVSCLGHMRQGWWVQCRDDEFCVGYSGRLLCTVCVRRLMVVAPAHTRIGVHGTCTCMCCVGVHCKPALWQCAPCRSGQGAPQAWTLPLPLALCAQEGPTPCICSSPRPPGRGADWPAPASRPLFWGLWKTGWEAQGGPRPVLRHSLK